MHGQQNIKKSNLMFLTSLIYYLRSSYWN